MITRAAALLLVVLVTACGRACPAPPPRPPAPPPTPPAPALADYPAVGVDDYLIAERYTDREIAYFRTADGLTCSMSGGWAGCSGELPGTVVPANEISLGGMRMRSTPSIASPEGRAAKALPVGHKIAYQGAECAVADGERTVCAAGSPPSRWFVVSPQGSGIGPRTEGLPPGFPDPKDFVDTDENYHVGSGAKNIPVYFTVDSGLTCEMWSFSGYEIGCDGSMPAASGGADEIYLSGMNGPTDRVGLHHTDQPRFGNPSHVVEIRRLKPYHRISYTYENRGSCLATADGGVACFLHDWGPDRPFEGFLATPAEVRTFG